MKKDKSMSIAFLQGLFIIVLFMSGCSAERSKYRKVYSGDYRNCCGIELGMVDDSHMEAYIYSHDFVGRRNDVYKGTYACNVCPQ